MEIIENKADEAWKKVLKLVLEKGEDFTDRDNRICREILNLIICVKNNNSFMKPIEIINSLKKWVYPPLEELENFILSKKDMPGYYYNYGARTFNFNEINQIDNYVIPLLKKDLTTRRGTIIFYNPVLDSSLFRKDTPGMITMNFNLRDDKLHVTALVRSNDLFFGWPANLYQSFILQKYVASKIGCELGNITTISISAHIFEDQFEDIKKII